MTEKSREHVRSFELLSRQTSRLLIVDMQQKLLPLIPVADRTIGNCRRLIEGAGIMQVPVFATEQYPKGLGETVPELRKYFTDIPSKVCFSCSESLNWGSAAAPENDRHQVVVAGIESHVCVLQTALDLISQGYRVFIPADAVASRGKLDWKIALERLSVAGATLTTTESVLFEWCEAAGTPEFKQISKLIVEGSSNSGDRG